MTSLFDLIAARWDKRTMTNSHRLEIRVYYEDTDFSGFVYHAGYLRFLERGRTEFLRALGITQSILHWNGTVFVVSRLAVDYRKPAVMDDVIVVETEVVEMRGASMRIRQRIWRGEISLVEAAVTVAAVRNGRPVRLPDPLRSALDVGSHL